jgi:hypothetical protein
MNLEEIREKIEALSGMNDLTDDQVKELEGLNKQARKMVAQEDAKKAAAAAKAQVDADREAEQDKKIREAIKSEREKWEAEAERLPSGVSPWQTKYNDLNKYDNLNATELGLMIETLNSAKAQVNPAAYKAMAERVADLKPVDNSEGSEKDFKYVQSAFKAKFQVDATSDKDAAIKAATDPMYSGGSGIGSDWVGSAYSPELWRVIRSNVEIARLVPEMIVADGYNNTTIPLQSSDPSFYKVAEVSAANSTTGVPDATITASQAATGSKNLTLGKLGARVMYSGEVVEDSLIPFVSELREQIQSKGAEVLESLLLDGDVETSANKNINDIAGTPAASDYFLIADGFRKLALVTNTANSRSGSGGLVIEDYIDTLKMLGTAGLAGSSPNAVAFIVDPNVHYANMKLSEVKTRDVFSAATIESGFLKMAYNVRVIPSWQMHYTSAASGYERKANTAGKVDLDTSSNNTTGAILAVRFDQWKQAFKRRMTMETTRFAESDSWQIVALARWGLAYRDTEASAITYNVGV